MTSPINTKEMVAAVNPLQVNLCTLNLITYAATSVYHDAFCGLDRKVNSSTAMVADKAFVTLSVFSVEVRP